jgi:hypothetical protein
MYPYCPYFFEHCWQLTCFYNNGSKPVLSQKVGQIFDNAGSCSFVNVNNTVPANEIVKVQPNPIDETSIIQFPHVIRSGVVTINSVLGEVITNIPVKQQEHLVIGAIVRAPGIYYYQVTDDVSGQTFTGKFVKH